MKKNESILNYRLEWWYPDNNYSSIEFFELLCHWIVGGGGWFIGNMFRELGGVYSHECLRRRYNFVVEMTNLYLAMRIHHHDQSNRYIYSKSI